MQGIICHVKNWKLNDEKMNEWIEKWADLSRSLDCHNVFPEDNF